MKILIFNCGDKGYGAEIDQVREVIRGSEIVSVPDTADFVEGVTNLRGDILPVINLRTRFGLKKKDGPAGNRIVVTDGPGYLLGIVVDEVSGVIEVAPEEISQPQDMFKDSRYLKGITKLDGRIIFIMDLKVLFTDEESGAVMSVNERVEIKKKK